MLPQTLNISVSFQIFPKLLYGHLTHTCLLFILIVFKPFSHTFLIFHNNIMIKCSIGKAGRSLIYHRLGILLMRN